MAESPQKIIVSRTVKVQLPSPKLTRLQQLRAWVLKKLVVILGADYPREHTTTECQEIVLDEDNLFQQVREMIHQCHSSVGLKKLLIVVGRDQYPKLIKRSVGPFVPWPSPWDVNLKSFDGHTISYVPWIEGLFVMPFPKG